MGPRTGKHKVGYVRPPGKRKSGKRKVGVAKNKNIMTVAILAMRLFRTDFVEHGYTKGCKGCVAVRRKGHAQHHTAACRTHMETVLAATPSGVFRLRQHDDRIKFAMMARLKEPGAPIYGTKNGPAAGACAATSEHVLQHPTAKGLPVKSVDGATSALVPLGIHMPRFGGRIFPEPPPRQMKLMRVYYEEHGCTKGCKGCAALRRKGWRQPHSAACRTHMETLLANTTSGVFRLRQHDDGGAPEVPEA